MKTKILFFPAGDKTVGGTRIHVHERVDYLRKQGINADILIKKDKIGKFGNKDRYFYFPLIFWKYDVIFFQKKLTYIDYLLMKFSKFFGKKVIFHIDDYFPEAKDRIIRAMKEADMVIVVSRFLEKLAYEYNDNVCLMPTFANVNRFKIKEHKESNPIVIGWLGHALFENLKIVLEPIENLCKKYDIKFKVIGDLDAIDVINSRFKTDFTGFIDPSKVPEELLEFDIGVMPCQDNELQRGAVPGKLLEYMATGLPTVSSPVGEILYIIEDGKNGFLANNKEEWENKLEKLIRDVKLRKKMGSKARKTIVDNYSIKVNNPLIEMLRLWK